MQSQATGLNDISQSMGELDTLTQQNAAMAEESSAAFVDLKSDLADLQSGASNFKIASSSVSRPVRASASPMPTPQKDASFKEPTKRPVAPPRTNAQHIPASTHQQLQPAVVDTDLETWEEF
ncbi:MAG: hypothetical protein OXC60_15425 [Litoreibacter sp.]|nr:hypothetical protein [Litoreibacter sp.]MCY4336048.1 hypothetical protein [Litoreibacter sp.]